MSDEDPLSEHECVVESSGQHHNPNVAWRCAEPDAKEKEVDKPPAEYVWSSSESAAVVE